MTKCPECGKDLLLIELFERIIKGTCLVLGVYADSGLDYGEEDEDTSEISDIFGYKCDKCGAPLFETNEEVETFIRANPDYQKEEQ